MGKLPLIMYRCIFMFLLLCTSCVEQKDTTSIKIDLMATDSDTLYYSSFVDSLSYIPLETKDDCLIREITDAILTNQYIFILDTPQQSVWIYSTKGKFIRSLHHQGNGPGEYINLIQTTGNCYYWTAGINPSCDIPLMINSLIKQYLIYIPQISRRPLMDIYYQCWEPRTALEESILILRRIISRRN